LAGVIIKVFGCADLVKTTLLFITAILSLITKA
jgi:hypothetical protein